MLRSRLLVQWSRGARGARAQGTGWHRRARAAVTSAGERARTLLTTFLLTCFIQIIKSFALSTAEVSLYDHLI